MEFKSFLEVSKLFDFDIFDLIDEIFKTEQVQSTMIEFNQDQLQAGQDALGQDIVTIGGSPYRPFTVKIRESAGLPTDRVTLEFSGAFYKTFQVRVVQNGYEVIADFSKPDGDIRDNLPSQFDVLGLDQSSATELIMEYVFPLLAQMIKQRLGIK
jgi:hypothetical protein